MENSAAFDLAAEIAFYKRYLYPEFTDAQIVRRINAFEENKRLWAENLARFERERAARILAEKEAKETAKKEKAAARRQILKG